MTELMENASGNTIGDMNSRTLTSNDVSYLNDRVDGECKWKHKRAHSLALIRLTFSDCHKFEEERGR